MNKRKPAPIKAWTESTRARKSGGRLPPKAATVAANRVSIRTQSRRDPSWFPQTPDTL